MVPEVICKWLQESNLGQIEGTWGGGSNEGLLGSNLCRIGKLAYIQVGLTYLLLKKAN